MKNLSHLLEQALSEHQLALADKTKALLVNYLELLSTWNRTFNLTSITNPRDMVYLHIIDSLLIQPYLHGTSCLDVGSGGGMPGIPLAIAFPTYQWVLLDKNSKKTRFLTQVIAELGLNNAKAVHSRCEDFQPEVGFDTITSRAYGSLHLFVESTAHLLKQDGQFVAMKGKYPAEELEDIPNSFSVQQTVRLTLTGMDIERHVICLKKS